MAEIDRISFALAVIAELEQRSLSYAAAIEQWPSVNRAMLSRAANGKTLAAGNFLLLCRFLSLDPYGFLITESGKRLTMKDVLKQAVTAGVTRETSP